MFEHLICGANLNRDVDAIFVNAPLRDYSVRRRINDVTLPVLGMAYIATYAQKRDFNVGVIDAEALGLTVEEVVVALNCVVPRWVGFNLLAPTFEMSARIADKLNDTVKVMLGGPHAIAMPYETLADSRFRLCEALVLGEAETRVSALLEDVNSRQSLPGVMWIDASSGVCMTGRGEASSYHLAPDINDLPIVDRKYLVNDPYTADDGRIESNIVGSRGCPYNCSFCGAAVSRNPRAQVRTRNVESILLELEKLHLEYGASAFRFVDDLFLGCPRLIRAYVSAFKEEKVGSRFVWDATGRVNILDKVSDEDLCELRDSGCREVALGLESGSERLLKRLDKRISIEQIRSVVSRIMATGISVKGYFMLGIPTETRQELESTITLIQELRSFNSVGPGRFRDSVFEFRPYPGTAEWQYLLSTGRYTSQELMSYVSVDLSQDGARPHMARRDEFSFSTGLQFGETPTSEIQAWLVELGEL